MISPEGVFLRVLQRERGWGRLHGHRARPEQCNERFARGETELPHDPALQPGPNYARGVAAVDEPHGEQPGRFSRGQEVLPEDDPEKLVEGDFSVASEQAPTSR